MFPENSIDKIFRLINEITLNKNNSQPTYTSFEYKKETKMHEINYIYITGNRTFADHHGVICFGYRNNMNNTIDVSACFCSPKDRFSKKQAHWMISGRMNTGKCVELELPEEFTNSLKYKDAVSIIMYSFVDDNDSWLKFMDIEVLPEWVYTLCDEYCILEDSTSAESVAE